MKTYLITLRNPIRKLLAAAILEAETAPELLPVYLSKMPPPFNSYTVLASSSTHDNDNWQYTIAFGPFESILEIELMTAAPARSEVETPNGEPSS